MRNRATLSAAFVVSLIFSGCGKAQPTPPSAPATDRNDASAGTGGRSGGEKPSPSNPGNPGNTGNSGSPGASGPMGSGGSMGSSSPDAGSRDATSAQDTRSSGSGGSRGGGGDASVVIPEPAMAGPPGPWARNVAIGLVEVSQGVFIKVGEGATVVPAGERNAPLIERRPLLVRVHVTPEAGFTARRLRGVVTVGSGDGSKQYEDAKMIAGKSDPERVETTFNVLVPAEDVKGGAGLSVAVYEAGPAMGDDPASPPRFPAMNAVDLGVKTGRMVLDVVVVPVTGPGGAIADTPERRLSLEKQIYDLYPVQKVNLRFHAPHVAAAKLTTSSAGFTILRNLRTMEQAKPHEYYHLIVTRADANYSFAGVASGAGASMGDGNRRVAITVTSQRVIDGNPNTMAHELGHNHGRNHAPACGATGDSMYPLPMGQMAVNGFAITEMALKSKTRFRELMGYCRPRWVSDYTWKALETRVRAVSAFANAQPSAMALMGRSIQGYAGPGEVPDWGIVSGKLVDDDMPITADQQARLTFDDGRTMVVPVAITMMTDDETREIAINLPEEGVVTSAEVILGSERYLIPVSSLPSP
jgi:hypothetical protein